MQEALTQSLVPRCPFPHGSHRLPDSMAGSELSDFSREQEQERGSAYSLKPGSWGTSIPSYYIGYFGGRPFIEKYGKWFLVSKKDLEDADKWVEKYGDWAFFVCRMLPVIRTFISLPAGILKAKKRIFFSLTFLGSLVWSYLLVYVGVKMGQNMEAFKHIWHKFDVAIVVVCLALGVAYLYKHFKHLSD